MADDYIEGVGEAIAGAFDVMARAIGVTAEDLERSIGPISAFMPVLADAFKFLTWPRWYRFIVYHIHPLGCNADSGYHWIYWRDKIRECNND